MRIIEVVDYQQNWPELFAQESAQLSEVLATLEPTIHHIGSTAVVGLAAKPVIDILLEVDDVSNLDDLEDLFTELGYLGRGELGIPGRRYFQKGGDLRSHQIHTFARGSDNVLRHLAFRDYLIHHPDIACQYSEVKHQAAQSCNNDIDRYCEAKDSFVQHHEKLALQWFEQRPCAPQSPVTLDGDQYSFFDQLVSVHSLPRWLEAHLSDPDSDYHQWALDYQLLIESPLLQRVWQIDSYGDYWLEINTLDPEGELQQSTLKLETASFKLLPADSYLVLDERN